MVIAQDRRTLVCAIAIGGNEPIALFKRIPSLAHGSRIEALNAQ